MKRLWKIVHAHVEGGAAGKPERGRARRRRSATLRRQVHQTLVKVGDDIGRRRMFNTAIAAVMELFNALAAFEDRSPQGRAVMQEALDLVVLMLSPIVPHATQAMWRALGHATLLVDERWPEADAAALVQDTVEIVVQVNGKLRARIAGAGRRRRGGRARGGARRSRRREVRRGPAGAQADLRARQARQRGGLMRRRRLASLPARAASRAAASSCAARTPLPAVVASPYRRVRGPLLAALRRARQAPARRGRDARGGCRDGDAP